MATHGTYYIMYLFSTCTQTRTFALTLNHSLSLTLFLRHRSFMRSAKLSILLGCNANTSFSSIPTTAAATRVQTQPHDDRPVRSTLQCLHNCFHRSTITTIAVRVHVVCQSHCQHFRILQNGFVNLVHKSRKRSGH